MLNPNKILSQSDVQLEKLGRNKGKYSQQLFKFCYAACGYPWLFWIFSADGYHPCLRNQFRRITNFLIYSFLYLTHWMLSLFYHPVFVGGRSTLNCSVQQRRK